MFRIILKSLKTGVLTEANPFGGHASFGFPVIDFSRCTACDECARACPTGAIQTATPAPAGKRSRCRTPRASSAARASPACPEQAVSVSTDVEVAAYSREQLARTASFDIDPARRAVAPSARWKLKRGSACPNRRPACASGSAAGSGARSTCARWTRGAATAANWRSPPRPIRCTTWNASGSTWSRVPGTPTSCSSPGP